MVSRWCWAFSLAHGAVAFRSMQNDETLEAGALGQNRTLDPNRILCPVLAALWTSGNLRTDESGNVERDDLRHALEHGANVSSDFGGIQSMGVANYHGTHVVDQLSRDRCMPGITGSGTVCYARWLAGSSSPDVKRYLNIFEMNGLETVEHAVSTGVRGGNCNSPQQNDPCNGQYPCEELFQRYYASSADSDGRIYEQQIKEIICKAQAQGDRSGEFSYTHEVQNAIIMKLPTHTWQMNAAMMGWLSAFGRPDENGALYFTVADARAMLMEGRLPDGWMTRRWGCIFERNCPTMFDGEPDQTLGQLAVMPLPCDMDEPWWSETGVTVATGGHCNTNSHCAHAHALCIAQQCICGKGRNGVQMLYEGGDCVEQPSRMYMGETCRYIRADNPASPNVWEDEST